MHHQQVAFLEQALASAESSSELARQLGESGALNKLERAREHAFYVETGGDGELHPSPQLSHERYFTRLRAPYSPLAVSLTVTSLEPRLRQNQPWLPSKAAVSSPLSPATLLPLE